MDSAAYADSMVLEEDELGMESESESEPEEDVVTRFADGFRPLRVCMRFLELHMGRPVSLNNDDEQFIEAPGSQLLGSRLLLRAERHRDVHLGSSAARISFVA